ncbi:GNAT family N-acetyltransferase [Clostridium magnum]|uniref:Spermidine N(1)-acetyltransferase n=1 Tax=Clostridium magnum DSM 2767 TaxID=1121326 RepID=A0A162UMS7_9CLOT|nr:GNAT family protein [Clostridium magnum]KZL94090.1 spermidine N(1)-acetyltransferase [Clostridium magnum DSM 2767]SHH95179.1 Protein N-acetyltransferase, RimJ/RimL family [Clostridium magnum DSM 2767]
MDNVSYSHFIDGERLYLREVRIEDVNDDYYRWMNDEEITAYTESRFRPYSIHQLKDYVSKMDGETNSIFLAIVDKATDKHVGNIKLGNINWIHRIGDIGIIIGEKNYWGKGYATEAIKLLTAYAFHKLNLHKVWAVCYDLNKGSIGAFKKAGFNEEGLLKEHYFYKGKYINEIIFGLTSEDFSKLEGIV